MTSYPIALLIHLLALLAATAASAIVHFAATRRAAAPTLRQAMEWGRVMGSAARVFPFAVITLIASGAWMVSRQWGWDAGWVSAGFTGAALLLVSGAVIGKRSAAAARASIARLQQGGHDLPNDGRVDPVTAILGDANTGFAIAIVVVMTIKPGLAASFGLLALGAAIGAFLARGALRAGVEADEETQAEAA
ncbi:MAG TPA: hypothetical protein VG818_12410 [Gemmatimonadaceae bacterium]|nr:hypothetical protein [Gemmatimonadaceae bacterium]